MYRAYAEATLGGRGFHGEQVAGGPELRRLREGARWQPNMDCW